ncbi:MAG: PilZ domain-containing protein [Halieaceae bacterium]
MADEQRKYVRLTLESTVFLELMAAGIAGEETAEVAKCKTLDISRGGLRVQVGQPLTIGAILQIGVELSPGERPLYLAGEVKWCLPARETEQAWTAGFALLNASDSDIEQWYELVEDMER